MNEYEKEKLKLKDVIERFGEVIEKYKIELEKIPFRYREDPYLLEQFLSMYSNKLRLLNNIIEKPYFARINFKIDGDSKVTECYLSKVGVDDENQEHLTIDWRAPIASVYYDSNVGRASYEAPSGTISGELLLKRQYDIEKGELLGFRDVDIVSNDEILKPYLDANADYRLKNIIATIQSEQNDIIREKLSKNLIVQGVAGSGKTTVALHRIAYLVYNNADSINPDRYLIIGPNKFFVNYISGVLPDLDVANVKQLTFDELVANYIKEEFHFAIKEEKLIKSIYNEEQLFFEKLKNSMLYKNALDRFMDDYMNELFGGNDLEINGYKVIDGNIIRELYQRIKDDFLYQASHKKKIDRVMLMLSVYIERNKNAINSNIWKEYHLKIEQQNIEDKKEEMENYRKVKEEIDKNCKKSIKKYFSKANPKILVLYQDFLTNISNYIENAEYDLVTRAKECANNIKKKKVEFEDLAALMYLKYKLQEPEDLQNFKHIVIDEAQDLGDFNFYVLKQVMNQASFSIFGDLTQSIYQYRSIKDWDSVINKTFDDKCDMKYLLKSYRTTAEIMNSANYIVEHINMKPSEPVIRHGDEVICIESDKNQIDILACAVNESLNKGYKSIAIITKTEEEAISISKNLNKIGIEAENINSKKSEYNGGICTIPCYFSKGLEFDSVILSDASEKKYNSDKIIDMKLLYVAMTRALHSLIILHDGELTAPLQNKLVIKNKDYARNKVR